MLNVPNALWSCDLKHATGKVEIEILSKKKVDRSFLNGESSIKQVMFL